MSSITCENGPGSPSAFRSGGSKVIRRLLRGRREKPGDEASTAHIKSKQNEDTGNVNVTYCGTHSHPIRLSHINIPNQEYCSEVAAWYEHGANT